MTTLWPSSLGDELLGREHGGGVDALQAFGLHFPAS